MAGIIIGCIIAAILIAAAIAAIILLNTDPNSKRPAHIADSNGYVQAVGTNLYDGEGNILQLKGVNVGNWFIPEPWMSVTKVNNFETGVYTLRRGRAAMLSNPNLTPRQAEELEELYLDTYIREEDFENIASTGMNAVRIPFCYMNLERDGKLKENAFARLDHAVDMCGKYGLYAILDMHGGHGSQNMDHHSGDDSHFELYGNAQNEANCERLWREIAAHFRDNKTVAGYDLLNEPRRRPHRYGGNINFEYYDRLYRAVREADPFHLIFIECFSFPFNGARIKPFGWKNICIEYHIYNLTPFSQTTCLKTYKALHNLMRYNTPVYIGEWNAYGRKKDWQTYFDYFDTLGWSFTSWTYKTNAAIYRREKKYRNLYVRTHRGSGQLNWGLYELEIPPVDLSSATYEEIAATYSATATRNAAPSAALGYWKEYLKTGAKGD